MGQPARLRLVLSLSAVIARGETSALSLSFLDFSYGSAVGLHAETLVRVSWDILISRGESF